MDDADLKGAAKQLKDHFDREKVTISVTLTELSTPQGDAAHPQPIETAGGFVEPATRIERATCGLRISQSPTSDNLTQQETTNPDASDMGIDGPELSCPGSSVVADKDEDLWPAD